MTNETERSGSELEAALARLTDHALSLPARVGHVALLLVATGMFVLVAALLATEPALASHTRWVFAAMLVIAASWAVYACWVLGCRRTLLASHRVIAGRMAVGFTGAFTIALLIAGYATGTPGLLGAGGVGILLHAFSWTLLRQAHRRFARLAARRQEIERQIKEVAA